MTDLRYAKHVKDSMWIRADGAVNGASHRG